MDFQSPIDIFRTYNFLMGTYVGLGMKFANRTLANTCKVLSLPLSTAKQKRRRK